MNVHRCWYFELFFFCMQLYEKNVVAHCVKTHFWVSVLLNNKVKGLYIYVTTALVSLAETSMTCIVPSFYTKTRVLLKCHCKSTKYCTVGETKVCVNGIQSVTIFGRQRAIETLHQHVCGAVSFQFYFSKSELTYCHFPGRVIPKTVSLHSSCGQRPN